MKKFKITAIVLAILLIVSIIGTKAKAFTATTIASNDTNKEVTITRNIKNVSNPVTNTFTYAIIEVSKPTGAIVSGMPDSTKVVFSSKEPDSSTNIVTQTGTIDLSSVTFDKLGDYKFKITETDSSNETNFSVDNLVYYFNVEVRNEVDNNNMPTGNLIVKLVPQATKGNSTTKQDIVYESEVKTTNLKISKAVTGERSDKYFEINLNISGNTADQYKISGNHSIDGETSINESTYMVGTTQKIY